MWKPFFFFSKFGEFGPFLPWKLLCIQIKLIFSRSKFDKVLPQKTYIALEEQMIETLPFLHLCGMFLETCSILATICQKLWSKSGKFNSSFSFSKYCEFATLFFLGCQVTKFFPNKKCLNFTPCSNMNLTPITLCNSQSSWKTITQLKSNFSRIFLNVSQTFSRICDDISFFIYK